MSNRNKGRLGGSRLWDNVNAKANGSATIDSSAATEPPPAQAQQRPNTHRKATKHPSLDQPLVRPSPSTPLRACPHHGSEGLSAEPIGLLFLLQG